MAYPYAMFPNVPIIIDRFHIIQLAMKAVQTTHITLQRFRSFDEFSAILSQYNPILVTQQCTK
ncbi:transposase [Weissella hellenica]|nr:transposase [Weissella hellenica]